MKHFQEWFDYLLNFQWVSLGNNTLIQPQRNNNGQWNLGDICVTDQEIIEACPSKIIENIQEFQLIHHSWRVARFKRYRPLIYFCAFGKNAIFKCVYQAIYSLIEFGQWRHDIAVFTAEETKDILKDQLLPLGLANQLHIIPVSPATDILDYTLARYRIDHPILCQAQPLLYLDTDILCDAPIDDLFVQLIDSDMIHACKEGLIGEGHFDSGGYWYGWRLMQEDSVYFNPYHRGFSSGALFFSNVHIALPFFELIIKSAYGFMQQQGYKDEFYDQRFTNYVLFKFKKVEIEHMAQWLNLYRIPSNTTLIPNHQRRLGLIHFLNVSTEDKLVTMKKYIEYMHFERKSKLS